MSVDAQRGQRLAEERTRLDMTQQQVADALSIRREMWAKYEAGAEPGASVLGRAAASGVDVLYVLTGKRPENAPSADEQRLLALYRLADIKVRQAVLAALATGEMPAAAKPSAVTRVPAPAAKTVKHGGITVHVAGGIGQQVEGGIHSPQTFNMGGPARKTRKAKAE